MGKFYLTNAIAYVNAGPHMGHALELCQGDALTRYRRLKGDDVFFLIGTDEHGTKIEQVAKTAGVAPQELADKNSALFVELAKMLDLKNDGFVRTTDDLHKRGAQKFWELIKDDFEEREYEGKYCTGCEAFVLDKDLVDGNCATHKKPPELLKEKNIFFKLSKYSDAIKQKVESGELTILPESRRNEFLNVLNDGLLDTSFSRPKKTLSWGIPVPGREDQVMYVWCDALTNYITALGFADDADLLKKYWPADVHLIGKDIIRFHAGVWIGMLLSAKMPLPKAIYVHGFVTSEGQKMSKSLGNVVDPIALINKYGMNAVRYYLLREIPSDGDGDFSNERFCALYKDELQNTIGNLVRRVLTLAVKNFDGRVLEGNAEVDGEIQTAEKNYDACFNQFKIKDALEAMVSLARFANLYVDTNKPWLLAKTDTQKLEIVLGNLIKICRVLGHMLEPIIPGIAQKILAQVGEDKLIALEPLFPPQVDA